MKKNSLPHAAVYYTLEIENGRCRNVSITVAILMSHSEYIKWMTVVVMYVLISIYVCFFSAFIYFIFGLSVQFDCIIISFEGKLCACAFCTVDNNDMYLHTSVWYAAFYFKIDVKLCYTDAHKSYVNQLVTLYYIL